MTSGAYNAAPVPGYAFPGYGSYGYHFPPQQAQGYAPLPPDVPPPPSTDAPPLPVDAPPLPVDAPPPVPSEVPPPLPTEAPLHQSTSGMDPLLASTMQPFQ